MVKSIFHIPDGYYIQGIVLFLQTAMFIHHFQLGVMTGAIINKSLFMSFILTSEVNLRHGEENKEEERYLFEKIAFHFIAIFSLSKTFDHLYPNLKKVIIEAVLNSDSM